MESLTDYSGKLVRDLQPSDFSYDTLVSLVKLYSKLYIGLDGFWYLTVKDRINNKEALACDIQVWQRMCSYEMRKITKQLNIQGDDVSSLMKALQINPWLVQSQYEIEISEPDKAVITFSYCPTLSALEKEGKGRESEICNKVCPVIFNAFANFFNPAIAVRCLKSPPRKLKEGIFCQWEFTMSG